MLVQELITYIDGSTNLLIITQEGKVVFTDKANRFENIYKDLYIENILAINDTLKIVVSYDN